MAATVVVANTAPSRARPHGTSAHRLDQLQARTPFDAGCSIGNAGKVATPQRSQLIRTLATIFISLLVAVALGTVTYALILAIGRDPLPGAEVRFKLEELDRPDRPQQVQSLANSQAGTKPTIQPETNTRVTVPIRVQESLNSIKDEHAGIATFDSKTGADFQWYPLNEALRGDNQFLLVTSDAESNSTLTVTLAAKRDYARHGYLARRDVEIATPANGVVAMVTLPSEAFAVQFELPNETDRAGPLRLVRVDDPLWLPMRHSSAGLTLRKDHPTTLKLGAGDYRLEDPIVPDQFQQFRVTAATKVLVSEKLAPARDDHR